MAGQSIAPLVVVVGQTATGKSTLALKLAERYNGEIICADSRTVYAGMDIGTAKPTTADQARVPHHGLDIVLPNEHFTAAVFKQYAVQAITDVTARGKLPVLVGGTGLYVDAILYDYTFRGEADTRTRAVLSDLSVPVLQAKLKAAGIPLPNNSKNPRHLVRALETGGAQAEQKVMRERTLVLGLQLEREEILQRITTRVEAMIAAGLELEVRALVERYGFMHAPLQTIGYQEWQLYFSGTQSLNETKQAIIKNTLSYAKRQKTWFKRNNSVHWINNRGDASEAVDLTTTFLDK